MAHFKEIRDAVEPGRVKFAIKKLEEIGFEVEQLDERTIRFIYKGSPVILYPYTGWYTGKTVKDGRGIYNLLNQITKWNLRNQDKIKAKFGDDFLKRILRSLNKFFSHVDRVEDLEQWIDVSQWFDISGKDGPYHTLSINDTESDDRMIHFYVISWEPFLRLAFIEISKC